MCVVVMSLFGGLILGMVLNVDSETVSTTGYKYTTDITGLFDSSDESYWTDYNPATNYYGYTNNSISEYSPSFSGISYTKSNIANNYPVLVEQGITSAGRSGNLDNSSSFPQVSPPEGAHINIYDTAAHVNANVFGSALVTGYKITTLYDWINTVWGINAYENIVINFTYPATSAPTTQARIVTDLTGGGGFLPDTLTINTENKTGYFISSGGYGSTVGLYESYIIYGDARQEETYIVSTSTSPGWDFITETYDTSLSLSYTSSVTTGAKYEYLNPTGGVSLASKIGTIPAGEETYSRAVWNNDTANTDYINGKVELLLSGDIGQGISFKVTDGRGAVSADYGVMRIDNGWRFIVNNNTYEIGDFKAISVLIDVVDFRFIVSPVIDFTNYTTYKTTADPILNVSIGSDWWTVGNIMFYQYQDDHGYKFPLTWSVINTWVLMDTHQSVLINPSINLAEYWPDMTAYRFYVQSVALYGQSVTINGINYPVTNNSIEINDREYTFSNFYLSYALDNRIYITFNNQSKTLDLGEIEDRTLSFTGVWYFNMGLYEGYQTTEEVYNWVPAFTGGADMLLLLGLAILGITCVALVKTGHKFKMWDYIVIGAGALILLLLLGAL